MMIDMSWLFNILLKKHSRREAGRMKIHQVLQEQVCVDYPEQTVPGNIYNNQVEVIMSNKVIQQAVKDGDKDYLAMIKRGVNSEFDDAVQFIENEQTFIDRVNKKI